MKISTTNISKIIDNFENRLVNFAEASVNLSKEEENKIALELEALIQNINFVLSFIAQKNKENKEKEGMTKKRGRNKPGATTA